jgi:hypothetical protein
MELHELLPAANYVICVDGNGNFYLDRIEDFKVPARIYGRTLHQTQRVLTSFLDRPNNTGVMLAGEKGSGKTLLAKNISVQAQTQGIPTIVINSPFHGDKFNSFLQAIEQPCIIFFDEFEKVYDKEQQEQILTLLDGVFPSKKLFLLTCNDKWRVDQHMRNRPGRIYYMLDFAGLEQSFIREYCQDNLKATHYIDQICKISSVFDKFNFDMLKAMVEEMNRYGESPQECMEMLNTKPEFSGNVVYHVDLVVDGQLITQEFLEDKTWCGNPLTHRIEISYRKKRDDDEEDWFTEWFTANNIRQVDGQSGKFLLVNEQGARLQLSRQQEPVFKHNFGAY